MQAVMVNGVRRTNALLGYADILEYSEGLLTEPPTWGEWFSELGFNATFAAAIYVPSVFSGFLPSPGEGPTMEQMKSSSLTVHGRGTMRDSSGKTIAMTSSFHIDEDPGYLNTARMLVESGMLLLKMANQIGGVGDRAGVVTPAYAFGSSIVERLEKETCTKFTISTA